MRPDLRSVLNLCLCLAGLLCGCATTVACGHSPHGCWVPPSLVCTITAPPIVRVGDRLPVRFMLRNIAGHWGTLHLLPHGTPFEQNRSAIFDVRRDGQGVGSRRSRIGHWGLDCQDTDCRFPEYRYMQLDPGESVSMLFELPEVYPIREPGIYQIGFDGYFDHVDEGPIPPYDTNPALGRRPRRFRSARVPCREASVLVLPREEKP